MFDPLEILRQLVAVPSVNPMGRRPAGQKFGEAALTALLEQLANRYSLAAVRQPVADGQDNLLLRFEGRPGPGESETMVLFDAHQDTVPVDGMSIDPFAAEIRAGRLYGRGACDVKGGMAAMLAALIRIAADPPAGCPSVVLSCTVNEECGFTGIRRLTEEWTPAASCPLLRKPDLAIVAEPTQLDVVVAHKGVLRWRCHTRGRAAHSSRPELGENAIYKMGRVLLALEQFPGEILGRLPAHPLCGRSTLCVGTIAGGLSANTIPDRCTIEIERRFPPGEDAAQIQRQLENYLAAAGLAGIAEHDWPYLLGLALSDAASDHLATQVEQIVRAEVGRCRRLGVPYATNAAFLAATGVPTIVFGPGCLEQAHTADEWIDIHQLRQAAEVYYQFLATFSKVI